MDKILHASQFSSSREELLLVGLLEGNSSDAYERESLSQACRFREDFSWLCPQSLAQGGV